MERSSLEQNRNPKEELKRQLNEAIDGGNKERAEQLLAEIFKASEPESVENKTESKEELPEYGEIDLIPLVFGEYKDSELKVSDLVKQVQEKYGEGYHLANHQDQLFFINNERKLGDKLNKYLQQYVCYFFFDPSEYDKDLIDGYNAITRFGKYDTRGARLSRSSQHRDSGMRVLVLKDGWEQEFLNQG